MSPRPIYSIMNPNATTGKGKPTPSPQDVILGRGGHSNHHLGNAVFRSVVVRAKPVYNAAPKSQKIIVARSIVDAVYSRGDPPGRFLQKNRTDGLWYEVPYEKAVEKTKQALREKTWKKETTEEDEEAEKVGMAILDLPALKARVSSCGGGGLLLAKTSSSLSSSSSSSETAASSSSSAAGGSLAGAKRKASSSPPNDTVLAIDKSTTVSSSSAASNCGCDKPYCCEPSLPLPPACVRQPSVTNTAPKKTAASAKKEQVNNVTSFNKFFLKMGPIPTTLARLTTALKEGSVEAPPPEKKRKILQDIEEGCHRRTMSKIFGQQQTPEEKGCSPLAPAPAPTMPLRLAAVRPNALSQSLPPNLPSATPRRPAALQHPSMSVPAYYGAYGTGFGNHHGDNQDRYAAAAAAPPEEVPMTSAAERVPTFCNPFDDDDAEDNAQQGRGQQPKPKPAGVSDWQKEWKSGGTPPASPATPSAPAAATTTTALRSDTTNFFTSLFFGRSSSESSSEGTIGSGAASGGEGSVRQSSDGSGSGSGTLTSLIRKASGTVMTALKRGLSSSGGSSPNQSLSGGISRSISLGLGRGLTMAMGFGNSKDDDNLPSAGPAGSFDWGDKDSGSSTSQPPQQQQQQQQGDRPEGRRMERRRSLIDDDDEEEERPELARLRSLETRPAVIAHRSKSVPYPSLQRAAW